MERIARELCREVAYRNEEELGDWHCISALFRVDDPVVFSLAPTFASAFKDSSTRAALHVLLRVHRRVRRLHPEASWPESVEDLRLEVDFVRSPGRRRRATNVLANVYRLDGARALGSQAGADIEESHDAE